MLLNYLRKVCNNSIPRLEVSSLYFHGSSPKNLKNAKKFKVNYHRSTYHVENAI